jgi:hypothetical protein
MATYNSINDKPSMISIDGGIGAGKSTVIGNLAEDPELATRFFFEKEPFNAYSDYAGQNIVRDFYEGECSVSYFQTLVHKSLLVRDMRAMEISRETGLIPVLERSSYTSPVFINWLSKRGLLTAEEKVRLEADISCHQQLSGLPPISSIAVICLQNHVAWWNVQDRERPEELNLELGDLTQLDFEYDAFVGSIMQASRFRARHSLWIRCRSVTAAQVTNHVKEILLEGGMEKRMCTFTDLPTPSQYYRRENPPPPIQDDDTGRPN